MKEPQCFSRFDYEFKVVQKLVELENICSKLQEENEKLQQDVLRLKSENSGKYTAVLNCLYDFFLFST